ncbi:MAG: SRPBCC family protein [Acidobacteriia bacterium]|nr:SRPBCC family protein [Terriglobia bacterium]
MKTQCFIQQSEIAASAEAVFAFHMRPEALEELTPPWERVNVIEQPGGLKVGSRAILRVRFGPFSRLWIAEQTEFIANRLFADIQKRGPFAFWYHRHRFEPTQKNTTLMTDEVEYRLPWGWLGHLVADRVVRRKLERLFNYRHGIVAEKMRPRELENDNLRASVSLSPTE